jgi:KDO2-lipid IV(A) lauroyltransferase
MPETSKSKHRPEKYKFGHRLESTLFNSLKRWGEGASEKRLRLGAFLLDLLLYHVLRICRKIVSVNLELAFPELSTKERGKIARANYRWFARFCMDVLHMDAWQGFTAKVTDFNNLQILDEALTENKGVLLVSGHFGNWEMIPSALAELGYSVSMYVGRQTNPLTNELQNNARANFGVQTIDKGKRATLQMGRALAANKIIAMLIDQNDNKSDLFVNFFAKLASSSKGAAAFHLLRKSPVILVTCPYVGDKFEITFQRISFELTGEQEKDTQHISQKINTELEKVILQYPEQYFWMHRRWRARPPEDSEKIY